jgi:glycosyltransferase involved in cell wall biosynthesis
VKDQAGLIRAFAMVRRSHPAALLVLAGDGPCRAELERLATDTGLAEHVKFLGTRDDVPAVMSAFDVFALPSIAEGISNTLLEAMASGLPVVATRIGGNPEIVAERVCGTLVPRQDPEALAAAISEYLEDPETRRRHGAGSRERAVRHFSLERMIEGYRNLYAGLAAGRLARSA